MCPCLQRLLGYEKISEDLSKSDLGSEVDSDADSEQNSETESEQRASEKITFPNMWTNTCYSHALGIPGKTRSELDAAILGAKRAARRKVEQELGIPPEQVPVDKFEFFTRIHYKAPSDGKWGEHESMSFFLDVC